jgi:MFS family permease
VATLRLGKYQTVLRVPSFRAFWLGFTFSAIGDAMTNVALIWYVYQATHAPQAVGLLLLCYTGPVILGGLIAGSLLDRFNRRTVMLVDSVFRGSVVAMIPLLYTLGHLALWHLYVVAVVYGLLYMITLAGGPSLVPALVAPEQLATANALETLSFTLSGVCGPPIAGLLILQFGAPDVLAIDALSYAVFALALTRVPAHLGNPHQQSGSPAGRRSARLGDAFRLVRSNQVLLSTTLMYMIFNVGMGFLAVWLPILAIRMGGGPEVYGLCLGVMAVGEVSGTLIAGSITPPLSLGILICLAQVLSGASLLLLLAGQNLWWVLPGLALLGVFNAPLTIWAQTLRMRIIPEPLRGRTFALLRTLIQSTGPLAGALAGLLLPVVGLAGMVGSSALLIGAPGLVGTRVKALRREADSSQPAQPIASPDRRTPGEGQDRPAAYVCPMATGEEPQAV